jgi:hypothetical protein
MIGHMRGTDLDMPIAPFPGVDGVFALDHMTSLDLELDFSADKLNMFSQDHCDGRVIYWTATPPAVIPITLDGFHIVIPVMLDGHQERALIDTGDDDTMLYKSEEERLFSLTLGAADTPENAQGLNGDPTLKTYNHVFKTLSLGDVTVLNPHVIVIPNAAGRNMDQNQLAGNRTKTEKDLLETWDMIIGMDVLRKLHIYFAFKEQKMYVTAATPAAAGAATP